MAAALVPRELANWGLMAVPLAAVDGGVLGVIVKNRFDAVASPVIVNVAVAVVMAAPAFSNLASFLTARIAVGRDKLAVLSRLMVVIGICLVMMVLPGQTSAGLVLFCVMAVAARIAWSGILIVRAAVWRANYTRNWRARVTARIVQMAALLMVASSALIGVLLDWRPDAFKPAFIIGSGCALAAAQVNRKARVRRQQQLIAAELAEQTLRGGHLSIALLLGVLRRDRDFRHYMMSMMAFGSGNLMLLPMLVVLINERLHLGQLQQVLLMSSLPLLVLSFSVPLWGSVLDRRHIFSYRAVQSWFFVATSVLFSTALIGGVEALLWPASVLLGAAYAGGRLGWNLGHNDFSSDANASHYMAIHVMLTGLRGLAMPLVGIGFYQFLVAAAPAYKAYALLLPISLTLTGAVSFVFLHLQLRRRQAETD